MSCLQTLRERGYRVTPQRRLVSEAIHNADGHISAQEIYTQVRAKYPRVNICTVYRTLDLFEHLGLVTKTDLGQDRVLYHHAEKGHHHHLVCHECGAIIDLDEPVLRSIERVLLRDFNFRAELKHLAIFGLCSNCR